MLLKVTVDGVVYDVEVEVEEDPRPIAGCDLHGRRVRPPARRHTGGGPARR